MFFLNKDNNKKKFTESDLLNNPKIIKKIKSLSDLELVAIIEESIAKKEWIKINTILQSISTESRLMITREIRKNTIIDHKINTLIFKNTNSKTPPEYTDGVFREIDKNTDW
jgi:hypothetical protein